MPYQAHGHIRIIRLSRNLSAEVIPQVLTREMESTLEPLFLARLQRLLIAQFRMLL